MMDTTLAAPTNRPFTDRGLLRRRKRKPTKVSHRAMLDEMTDEEVMGHLQAGTVEAFDVLFERYAGRLTHYLGGFVRDAKQAEDLLQETFMRVFRNRHAYHRIARFSTWVYTIAGNLARSEYRKHKRRKTSSMQAMTYDNEEYELQVPDEALSPEDIADGAIQDRYIQEALNDLPVDFREVVILRDIQQLAYDEIAEITGLPMGTVKSRINRGRSKLQEALKPIYG